MLTDEKGFFVNANNDIKWFTQCAKNNNLVDKLKEISLVITDVDGSLTDGRIEVTEEKESSRSFSIVDGFCIVAAQKSGLAIAFLSGKRHASAQLRSKSLGIPDDLCIEGKREKLVEIERIVNKRNETLNNVLFFGDDFLDARVKTAKEDICFAMPHDAPFYLQPIADLVVPRSGSNHAFRLLLDLVLFVQQKHFAQDFIQALM